jgi:hypothetical protein
MSRIKDKFSNKQFEFTTHAALSASVASTGLIGGKVANFVGIKDIPFRLKSGDQSHYFDITKVETSSQQPIRVDNGTVYVPYKKKNWQSMLIGPGSFISSSFQPAVYLQISAAFASKISNVDDDFIITQMVEENYTSSLGPKGSFVGPVTASYQLRVPNTTRLSYSGIDTGSGIDFNIDNDSSFSHASAYKQNIPAILSQSISISSSLINFRNTLTNSSSFTNVDSPFSNPASGSVIGKGSTPILINSSSLSSGTYRKFTISARIAGDGDSGSLYDFLPAREIVIYSSSAVVASGSFKYHPTRPDFASSSGVATEIFYVKSTINAGPSGSYTGSCVLGQTPIGSPIHATANLRETASYGYYYDIGKNEAYLVSSSAVDNAGIGFAPFGKMIVPRIVSKSFNP